MVCFVLFALLSTSLHSSMFLESVFEVVGFSLWRLKLNFSVMVQSSQFLLVSFHLPKCLHNCVVIRKGVFLFSVLTLFLTTVTQRAFSSLHAFSHTGSSWELAKYGPNPLRLWARVNLSCFKLWVPSIWSQ